MNRNKTGLFLACFMLLFVYSNKAAVSETYPHDRIQDGAVQVFNDYMFIIKFTNLIYEVDGKEFKIPIFRGNMGDVTYREFQNYCVRKNYMDKNTSQNSFVIKTERGKITKTLHDFLMFYKSNILKDVDINKPARVVVYGRGLYLFYEFTIDDVPFVLTVRARSKELYDYKLSDSIKSVLDIKLDETIKKPHFSYDFWKNTKSQHLPIVD